MDLYRADFINMVSCVLRRKLERLHALPYHHALLRWGISKREEEKDCELSLCQGMELLGTRAQIPTGYMVKTLRSQSTCDSNMPSDQMLSTF